MAGSQAEFNISTNIPQVAQQASEAMQNTAKLFDTARVTLQQLEDGMAGVSVDQFVSENEKAIKALQQRINYMERLREANYDAGKPENIDMGNALDQEIQSMQSMMDTQRATQLQWQTQAALHPEQSARQNGSVNFTMVDSEAREYGNKMAESFTRSSQYNINTGSKSGYMNALTQDLSSLTKQKDMLDTFTAQGTASGFSQDELKKMEEYSFAFTEKIQKITQEINKLNFDKLTNPNGWEDEKEDLQATTLRSAINKNIQNMVGQIPGLSGNIMLANLAAEGVMKALDLLVGQLQKGIQVEIESQRTGSAIENMGGDNSVAELFSAGTTVSKDRVSKMVAQLQSAGFTDQEQQLRYLKQLYEASMAQGYGDKKMEEWVSATVNKNGQALATIFGENKKTFLDQGVLGTKISNAYYDKNLDLDTLGNFIEEGRGLTEFGNKDMNEQVANQMNTVSYFFDLIKNPSHVGGNIGLAADSGAGAKSENARNTLAGITYGNQPNAIPNEVTDSIYKNQSSNDMYARAAGSVAGATYNNSEKTVTYNQYNTFEKEVDKEMIREATGDMLIKDMENSSNIPYSRGAY